MFRDDFTWEAMYRVRNKIMKKKRKFQSNRLFKEGHDELNYIFIML